MPRSATDATRFTSTIPHASAKLGLSGSNQASNKIPPKTPGPPGESPQEKVKRLRAVANAAREAQVSTFDKVILRGRVWADRLHKFTALSLIGITCMALLDWIAAIIIIYLWAKLIESNSYCWWRHSICVRGYDDI
jgi:hypothetical protein